MTEILIEKLARQLGIALPQVTAVVLLLDGGATVPFIARYRKEMTGSLDEVQIANIRDGMERLKILEERRTYILETIKGQDKLTPELEAALQNAEDLATLEDLYLPYKPKRRTRAVIARERGLEPLAKIIMAQRSNNIAQIAEQYVDSEKGVESVEDALAGARDIVAEWINESARARDKMRKLFARRAVLTAKVISGKEEDGAKYRDYFDYSEAAGRMPSHRFLAIQRGMNEDILRVSIEPEQDSAIDALAQIFVRNSDAAADQVQMAVSDSYKRLMAPSLENELRSQLKERADAEAINVFASSLYDLLMAAPLGEKRVLALDPGFRTGCKLVCLDEHGTLLHNTTIYPHDRDAARRYEAANTLERLVEKYRIEAIAIGNGTAGRETQDFVKKFNFENVNVVMVNESGASIYSASEVARQEFPDHDITVRGAVSIGRRLMDPLAELVKIDPKSIGVGQYQHDVEQNNLKRKLDDTVINCVNKVGVEANTASRELLTYVSGIGTKLASNIIAYRTEKGGFNSKAELLKVSGLGPKAYEQCAGFLRIRNAANPLDASAVHPESYGIVAQIAKDYHCTIQDLVSNDDLRRSIDLHKYINDKVGLPTLNDIMAELSKPGRDPRESFENVEFDQAINNIEDLREGMILRGVVTNMTAFGAFVDIGVHHSGLLHIGELTRKLGKDAMNKMRVNQQVNVQVLQIDLPRKRIGLSLAE